MRVYCETGTVKSKVPDIKTGKIKDHKDVCLTPCPVRSNLEIVPRVGSFWCTKKCEYFKSKNEDNRGKYVVCLF